MAAEVTEFEPVPLNVMILDDDPGDIELLHQAMMNMGGYEVQTFRAQNLASARDILARFSIDLLIVDNCLGFESGLDTIREIGGRKSQCAIIMISGMLGRELQEEALEAGAMSYLDKKNIQCDLLEATIRSSIYTHAYENGLPAKSPNKLEEKAGHKPNTSTDKFVLRNNLRSSDVQSSTLLDKQPEKVSI